MGEKTKTSTDVSREQAADLLQQIATELRQEGPADIEVGNKTLRLSPAPELEYRIQVEERSPMLGSPHEEITVALEWVLEDEPA